MTNPHAAPTPSPIVKEGELDTTTIQRIAAILDHPSVFMGGPSRQSLRTAEVVYRGVVALSSKRIEELEQKLTSARATIYTFVRAQEHYREAMDERNTLKNEARALAADNERLRSQLAWAYGEVDNLKGGTVPALEEKVHSLAAQVAGLREELAIVRDLPIPASDTRGDPNNTTDTLAWLKGRARAALAFPTEPVKETGETYAGSLSMHSASEKWLRLASPTEPDEGR